MTTEKNAYAHLKKIAPKTTMFTRVENSVAIGMPDVFFRSRTREGWIENKVGVVTGYFEPVISSGYRKTTQVRDTRIVKVPRSKLKLSQEAWMTAYTARGGAAYIHLYVSPQMFFLIPFSSSAWLDLGNGLSPQTWLYQHKHSCEVFGEH
jgi:hypothetical protein